MDIQTDQRRTEPCEIMIYGCLVMLFLAVCICVYVSYKINRLEESLQNDLNEKGRSAFHSLDQDTLWNETDIENGTAAGYVTSVLGDAGVDLDDAAENTDSSVKQNKKRVYLTFDDGPSVYTDKILDILAANDVKATFFVIGKDEEYYDAYKRIVEEGHTIGMHSFSHVYQDFYRSQESFAEELTKLNELIYDVTGTKSTIFRFPGGSSNSVTPLPVEEYIVWLNENNINYYDWNALNGDAVTCGLSPDQLVKNIMNDVSKNEDAIVLMHDLATTHATVESLQLLIDMLKASGYEILPINAETPLIQHVSCNSIEE